MGNRRFALASLSVEPKDPWSSASCVAHPVDDIIQDLRSGAIKTQLLPVQPDFTRTNQGIQAKVFADLLNAILDTEECPITELLHQFV